MQRKKIITCFITALCLSVLASRVCAAGTNLLSGANSGFENAPALQYWVVSDTASAIDRSTALVHAGSYSCHFSTPISSFEGNGVLSSTVSVTAGNKYSIRSWFAVTRPASGLITDTEIRVRIAWINASGVVISTGGYSVGQTLAAFDTWQQVEVSSITAPGGSVAARLILDCRETAANKNPVYADDAEIEDIQVVSPAGFSGQAMLPTVINWSWTAVSDADGYRVIPATGGVLSGDLLPNVTYWLEQGLQPNTTYSRSVESFIGGESSGTVTAAILTPSDIPAPPFITVTSSTSFLVQLDTTANPPSTEYSIKVLFGNTTYFVQTDGNLAASAVYRTGGDWGTVTVQSLSENSLYSISVNSRDALLRPSVYSMAVSSYTLAQTPAIGYYLFVETSRLGVFINTGNNPEGTLFSTEISTTPAFSVLTASSAWLSANNYTFDSLLHNTTYYLRCRAQNGAGINSGYSATDIKATKVDVPKSLQFTAVSTDTIVVSWAAHGNGPATIYELEMSDDNTSWGTVYTGTLLNCTTSHAYNNQRYYFRARAKGIAGEYSFYTLGIDTATLAVVPLTPSVTATGTQSLQLTIPDDGNSSITEYAVKVVHGGVDYYLLANGNLVDKNFYYSPPFQDKASWGTPITCSGLLQNEQYTFSVSARNDEGVLTAWSPAWSAYTLAAAPTGGSVAGWTTHSSSASWLRSGNSNATDYRVAFSSSSDFTGLVTTSSWMNNTLGYLADGLTAFTSYYFRVQARNGDGVATASSYLGVTTVLPSNPVLQCTSGHVSGAKSNHPAVHLNAVSTAQYDHFVYTFGTSNRSYAEVAASGASWDGSDIQVNCVDPGDPYGTWYYFQAVALNPAGVPSSAMGTFSVFFDTVPPHVASAVSETPTSVVVTYDEPVLRTGASGADSSVNASNYSVVGLNISSAAAYDFNSSASFVYTVAQTPGAPYVITVSTNIADSFGNTLNPDFSTGTFTGYGTNTAPRVAFQSTPSQGSNGDGVVTIPLTVTDAEQNKCALQVNYSTTSVAGPWSRATIDSVTCGYYDTSGSPSINNAQQIQIGTATHSQIITYYPNSVQIHWDTVATLGNFYYSTVFTSVTATDLMLSSSAVSGPFIVDNKIPNLGDTQAQMKKVIGVTPASITWTAYVPYDDSSYTYHFYGSAGDSGWTNSSTSTLSGLIPNTAYNAQVSVRDVYGNETTPSSSSETWTRANVPVFQQFADIGVNNIVVAWGLNNNPLGTPYYIEASSVAPGGAPVVNSGWITGFQWNSEGLMPNATYYFRGKARNGENIETDWTVLGATITRTNIPFLPSLSSISISSITVSWNSYNPDGTVFDLRQAMTNTTSWTIIYNGPLLTSTAVGLAPNMRYFFQTRSRDALGSSSRYSSAAYAYTLCVPPANIRFTSSDTGSLTLAWDENGNPSGTGYEVETSVDGSSWMLRAGVNISSYTDTTNMAPNTEHYYRVRARNNDGVYTSYAPPVSSHTLAAVPVNFHCTAVSSGSVAVAWNANGNSAGTVYSVEASPDASAWMPFYSGTLMQAATGDLLINTTAYIRVRAFNDDNVPTAYSAVLSTHTLAAVPGTPIMVSVSSSTAVMTLVTNGNPPLTLFAVKISSGSSDYWVQADGGLGMSAAYRTAGDWGTITATGLSANRPYIISANALNIDNVPTAYSSSVSSRTLAAVPAAGPFLSVSPFNIMVSWQPNGNPSGTAYRVENITTNAFSATGGLNWTNTSLTPNTTYFYRVKAFNGDNADTVWAALGSTMTWPATPGLMVTDEIAVSSISVRLAAGANPYYTQYSIQVTSAGWSAYLAGNAAGFSDTPVYQTTTTWSETGAIWMTGLSTNTAYDFESNARNELGVVSAYPGFASAATRATAAADLNVTGAYVSSVTVSWNSTNPSYTRYELYMSSDSFSLCYSTPITLAQNYVTMSAAISSLVPDTTYWYRVRAFNENGLAADYSNTVSTITYPAAPSYTAFTVLPETATIAWLANNNPSSTLYTEENITLGISSATYRTSWQQSPLTPNTTYQYRLKAAGKNGYETPWLSTTVVTRANTPGQIVIGNVYISSFTMAVTPGSLNPDWTEYAIRVSSAAGGWTRYAQTDGNFSATPVYASTTSWTNAFTPLNLTPNTTFTMDVVARNTQGVTTAWSVQRATSTLAQIPLASAYQVNITSISVNWQSNRNPSGTRYTAEETFTSPLSSVTIATQWIQRNLTPDTTYEYRVKAANYGNLDTDWVLLGTTITHAQQPGKAQVTQVNISSMSLHISPGLNPYWTGYSLRISSSGWTAYLQDDGGDFSAVPVYKTTSSWSSSGDLWLINLSTNTVYTISADARNSAGTSTGYGPSISSATLAVSIPVVSVTDVYVSSVTLAWVSDNPSQTRYEIYLSSDSFNVYSSTPVRLSQGLTAATTTLATLTPDTTYWFRTRAFNQDNVATDFSNIATTITYPAAPSYTPFTVMQETVTLNWAANANPVSTLYTGEDLDQVTSSSTYLTTWQEAGLIPNTTYHYRLKASGKNGYETPWLSTTVVTLASTPGQPVVYGLSTSSITFFIATGDNNPAWTEYSVRISSADGAWARYLNTGKAFSASPVYATTTSWTNIAGALGLSPNTTFTIEVTARNSENIVTPFGPSFSVATLAMPPAFAGMVQDTYEMRISWSSNQNPTDTWYTIEDTTLNISSTSQAFTWIETGLIPNTTHSYRIKAANRAGIDTSWVAFPDGCTLVEQPGKPWIADVGITSTTISINTGNNSSFTEYAVRISSPGWTRYLSGGNGEPLSSSAVYLTTTSWSGTGSIWVTGLSTNTVYSYTVGGKGGSHQTSFDYTSSTATFAVTPAASTITAVNISSVTLSWDAATNPSWTRYEVTYSSDNFVVNISTGVRLSSGLKALTTSVIALNPDTTYWFRVRAYNEDGIPTGCDTAVSSITLSRVPSVGSFVVSSDSIRVNWGANSNPSWTRYVAENTVAASSIPAQTDLNWQETGLTPNTTYQYRVQSINGSGVASAWAAFWSTSTLAAVPSLPAVSGVAISSVNYQINGGVNPGWTEYGVRVSSNSGSWVQYARTDGTFGATPVYASTTTWGESPWVKNLVPNTAYSLSVAARNNNGVVTAYSMVVDTLTIPATPFGLAPSAVSATTVTLSWNANANPNWTKYELSYSTDSFTSDIRIAFTYGDNHTTTTGVAASLIPNTTYQYRVRVFGDDGSAYGYSNTASTVTVPSAPNGLSWSDIGISSITIAWTDTTVNPDDTLYRVELSTWNGFTGTVLSSATIKDADTAFFNPVTPNTTYYGRVVARSWNGVETPAALGSRITLAAAPDTLAFTAINISSSSLSWNGNGNPSWTRYEVTYSPDNFVASISTGVSLASGLKALTTSVIALNPDTTYWFRVRAYNNGNIATAFTNIISSITLTRTPSIVGMAVSSDAIRITWGANTNPAWTQYVAENMVSAGNITQAALIWEENGLSPNTTYQYRVKSVNGSGISSAWATFWAMSTLAVVPNDPSIAGVAVSSINYRMNESVNPGWTEYGVRISSNSGSWIQYARTDGTFGATPAYASTTTWGASPWVKNLVPNTAYRLSVAARNNNGVVTAYSTVVDTLTISATPLSLAFTSVNATGVTLSWNANANPNWTKYELSYSTDSFTSDIRTAFTYGDNHTATTGVVSSLIPNTTYQYRVRVFGDDGSAYGYSNTASTVTVPSAPNVLSWSDIGVSSITIAWADTTGNPGDTVYRVDLSTWNGFTGTVLSSATIKDSDTAFFNPVTPNTTYYGRVVARSWNGVETPATLGSRMTLAAAPDTLAFTAINISSVSLSWNGNSNPSWTRYEVTYSPDNFVAGISTGVSLASGLKALTTSVIALNPDTTYWFRVRAYNDGNAATAYTNFVSSTTLTRAPSIDGMTISSDTIRVTWGANTNPAWTRYVAEDMVSAGNVTQAALVWTENGLTPNTTYQYRVKSVNGSGISSAWTTFWSTSTLAVVPSRPAVSGVVTSSINYQINGSVNPGWTEYGVRISSNSGSWVQYARTDGTFGATPAYASTTTWGASPWVRNLVPNTAYSLSVAARNNNGVVTAYSTVVDTLTISATPRSLWLTAVNTDNVVLSWNANANPNWTKYELSYSTDSFTSDIRTAFTYGDNHTTTTGVVAGLIPNTTYQYRVRVFGDDGSAYGYSNIASSATVTTGPNGLAWGVITTSSIAISWSDTTVNPPDTVYRYELSTVPDFSSGVISSETVKEAGASLIIGLTPNTTYYGRMVAYSRNGREAVTDLSPTSRMTMVSVPNALAVTSAGTSSVKVIWSANGNPAWTKYELAYSTDSFVSSASAFAFADNHSYSSGTVSGLSANTTYWLQVRAYNEIGIPTEYTTAVSTITLARTPIENTLTVSSSAITVAWDANANPDGTIYVVENVTNANSLSLVTLSWQETGLAPNTTYQYRVKAVNGSGVPTIWATFWSTSTLAAVPGPATINGVEVSSVSYSINGASNPGNTEYGVQISSGNGIWTKYARTAGNFGNTVIYASTTSWGATPWIRNLEANTAYRISIAARNNNGVATAYSTAVDTLTIPALPQSLTVSSAYISSVTVSWNANANPSWTRYELNYSTDNFTGDLRTAFTFTDGHTATTGTVASLMPNTTYQYRVRVYGEDGSAYGYSNTASTVTVMEPANGVAWAGVTPSSLSISWADTSTNPPDSIYRYELSSVPNFNSAIISSATIKSAGAATIGGLIPNTTYYGRLIVRSRDGREAVTLLSPLNALTRGAVPADMTVMTVNQSSVTVNWNANGNPVWTKYEITYSTDNFVSHQAVSGAFSDSILVTTFTVRNLVLNTTYYFRARAMNSGAVTTGYSAAASTVTVSAIPNGIAWGAQASSGLTITWTDTTANPALTVYRFELCQLSNFSGAILSSATTRGAATAFIAGLTPNTTYYGRVIARSHDGRETAGASAPSASIMTLGMAPSNIAVTGVSVSSITVSWNANTNPAGTRYELTRSTDAFAANVSTATGFSNGFTGTVFTVPGLVPNTTYYFRARACNGASIPTAYSGIIASVTTPSAPNGMSWSTMTPRAITAAWTDTTPNPFDSTYRYEVCSVADFSGAVLSSTTVKNAGVALVGGLTANTTYFGRIVAVSRNNVAVPSTILPNGVLTPSAPPQSLGFTSIYFTSVTVSWLANGNPAGTRYELSLSTDSFTQHVSTPVTLGNNFTAVSTNLSGLLPGVTYWFRLRSYDALSQASAYANMISTETLENYVDMGLNGTAIADRAIDNNFEPADGYEDFVSVSDTMTLRIDGDRDGKYDFLVSTSGSIAPEIYWDPDARFFMSVIIGDVDNDGVSDYVFDTNNDGKPDTYYNVALSSVMVYYPFVSRDVDGDGTLDYAYDDDLNMTNGFESYRSLATTATARVDGDFDGKYDFFISTHGTDAPEVYWDPDHDIFGPVTHLDLSGDGVPDYVFDATGDGIPESFYNTITSSVTRCVSLTGVPIGVPGTFIAVNGITAQGYDAYVDPTGQTSMVLAIDGDGDGKKDFLIDTNHDGVPERYVDPDDSIITTVILKDYDGDGILDWGIDTAGAGFCDKYYRMPGGPLLIPFLITQEQAYTIAPNPFHSDRGAATVVYDMKDSGDVIIDIYDIAGEKVAVLVNGSRAAGRHQVRWNGGNGEFDAADGSTAGSGNKLAKGIYIMRFKMPAQQYLKKIAIIR